MENIENQESQPGINGESFKVTIKQEWINNPQVLKTPEVYLKVVTETKRVYYQWYWKLLNILTLGFFFNEGYTYTVKAVENES